MDIRIVTTDQKKELVEGLSTLMLSCFVFALMLDRGWTAAAVVLAIGVIGTILYTSFGK